MVVRCSRCMDFKKSYKSPCKICKRRHSRQRGRGTKSFFKKVKKVAKNLVNLDIAKVAIS